MQRYKTDNLRIKEIIQVLPASKIHAQFPITEKAAKTVFETRRRIHDILHRQDDRILVVIGPCSIHDSEAAMEYAGKLVALKRELAADLLIVMRVYFEKPRTTVGWKGLINDPRLDESYRINEGLALARKLLLDVNSMGLPAGTEFLDLISPQYVADLVSWGAIGARTTESQGHRELASGLSCPIGFKNSTDGTMNVAVDAIGAAERPHVFMSMTKAGHSAIYSTTGNKDTHVILRGGNQRPNYDTESVDMAAEEMKKAGITPCLMVDFSHANSRKQYKKQLNVGQDVAGQISRGNRHIIGAMIESHLLEGNQKLTADKPLTYGQSITDACISWDDSIDLLHALAKAVRKRRKQFL